MDDQCQNYVTYVSNVYLKSLPRQRTDMQSSHHIKTRTSTLYAKRGWTFAHKRYDYARVNVTLSYSITLDDCVRKRREIRKRKRYNYANPIKANQVIPDNQVKMLLHLFIIPCDLVAPRLPRCPFLSFLLISLLTAAYCCATCWRGNSIKYFSNMHYDKKSRRFDLSEVIFKCIKVL